MATIVFQLALCGAVYPYFIPQDLSPDLPQCQCNLLAMHTTNNVNITH